MTSIVVGWFACQGAPKEPTDPDPTVPTADDFDGDGSPASEDCDDADPAVHPGATEVCDGADNDCDSLVDAEDPDVVDDPGFTDGDADGYGGAPAPACAPSTAVGGDCADDDPAVNPGVAETCAPGDEDCDTLVDADDPDAVLDLFYEDGDGDGLGGAEVYTCVGGPTLVAVGGDCDDTDAVLPGEWLADVDGDGAGGLVTGVGCTPPSPGDVRPDAPLDCDDGDPGRFPGAAEGCTDGVDEDCDALVDCEDSDCSGPVCGEVACSDGLDDDYDGAIDCDDDDCWGLDCHVDGVRSRILSGRFTVTRDFTHFTYWSYGSSGATWTDSHKVGVATGVVGEVVVAPPGQRFSTASTLTTCGFTVAEATLASTYAAWGGWFGPTSATITRAPPVRTGISVDPGCRLAGSDWLPQDLFLDEGGAVDPVLGLAWYPGGGPYTVFSSSSYGFQSTDVTLGSGSWTTDPVAGDFWPAPPDDDTIALGSGWSVRGLTEGWGDLYHPGDDVGRILAVVGDQNGDGIDDIAVGSPDLLATNPEGSVALVSALGDPITVSDAFATLIGEAFNDQAGVVGRVGDVNGDGFEDVAVGAPYAHGYNGVVYVVYGPVNAAVGLAGASVTLEAATAWDGVGARIGGAGDTDGDGKDDVLVGAPGVDGAGYERGTVYLLTDPASGDIPDEAVASIASDVNYEGLGRGPLGADGDFDGDGLADITVASTHYYSGTYGAVHVFRGPLAGAWLYEDAATQIHGAVFASTLGDSVATGDFDGDGLADLAIGDSYHGDAGALYVVTGVAGVGVSRVDLVAAATLTGAYPGDALGTSVASAGDRDGDGRDDLVVGGTRARVTPVGAAPGAAWLVSAPFTGTAAVDDVGRRLAGPTPADWAGATVLGGSDLDGDTVPDIVVGAPFEPGGGAAWLVSGADL